MTDKIKFLKTREVKSPSRANEFDAGIDFYVPTFNDEFVKDFLEKNPTLVINTDEDKLFFSLYPKERANIPSGIKIRMAESGRAFIAFNKSGVASKFGLVAGACVVDYLYQGEVHLNVINTSNKIVNIYEDMKLLQFIEMPIFNSDINVTEIFDNVSSDSFYEGMSTERGEGGFGSSDK